VEILHAGSRHTGDFQRDEELVWQGKNSEFSVFDFEQLLEATNHFSEENKLGQGGFGSVYKVTDKRHVYGCIFFNYYLLSDFHHIHHFLCQRKLVFIFLLGIINSLSV
jgi:hypothetical protein